MIRKESAIVVVITVFHTLTMSFGENALTAISNCTCEGYDQVYECRVTGRGATVWRGSAFNCPSTNNEILFLHSSSGIEKVCNDGVIVGRAIRAENDTYISQLTVSVSAGMIGRNISCYHDSGAAELIDFSVLTLTTDPFPPPNDIYLMKANVSQLVFQWESVEPSCEAIHYLINGFNCGHCPNVTNDTTVTCTGFPLDTYVQVCLLSVETVVCGTITGNESRSIQVTLRAPNSPKIDVIPTYSYNNKTLLSLTTRFNETEAFDIADGVNGLSTSYTINYTINSLPGVIILYKTGEISATASCVNGTCEYDDQNLISPLTPLLSSDNITVTVSGTNILGNGLPSNSVTMPGKSGQFVDVSVDFASKMVTCFFHQQTENCEKYCSIEYGPSRENCKPQNQRKFITNTSTSGNVVLLFPLNDSKQFQLRDEYCFTVTASNGTFTVLIEGTTLVLDTWSGGSSGFMLGTVIATAVIAAVIIIALLGVLFAMIFVIVKNLKTVQSGQAWVTNQNTAHRPANSEVDPQGLNETNEQGIGIYSLLQSVGDEPPESQTSPAPDPVYVDIGPSTTSQENTQMILAPPCDDKVEYAEVKQTVSTDSKPAAVLLDNHPDLDNLLIQLRDDVTPHWYEFGGVVGVPNEILEKCKDYPPYQCIVEVLDYWLMNHRGQVTWRNVAHALKEIQLHHLAEHILQDNVTNGYVHD